MIYLIQTKVNTDYSDKIDTSKSLTDALNLLKPYDTLALDVETSGLKVIATDLLMLQIGTADGDQYIFDMRGMPLDALKSFLEEPSRTYIGHNIKFDYNVLKARKILLPQVYDTMVADQVIYNGLYDMAYIRKNRRFSLAGVYKHYFKENIDKETRQQFHSIHDEPFTEQQIKYGALDVVYPFQIKLKQDELVKRFQLEECIKLENDVLLALGDIEFNGFHLNRQKWLEITNQYQLQSVITERELDDILLNQTKWYNKYRKVAYQGDLFNSSYENRRSTDVNWGSDKQVYDILTNVFNLFPADKHGKPSSGANAIALMEKKHPVTELLLKLRKEEKAINSFGSEYLDKFRDSDGRVRTHYNQIVETGRISSRNPNLQQIPKEISFRSAFEAPEGRVIITADYASQEARIMADRANDQSYIDFFLNDGGDVHSFVATKMFTAAFGKPFIVTSTNENKAYRQKGKILNFSISFGASAFTVSKSLHISQNEAQELIDSFFRGFPTLKKMFDETKKFALDNGYILTNNVTKRIRHFRYWKEYKDLKEKGNLTNEERSRLMKQQGSIERRAMNTPIQGTASDMTKLAITYIRSALIQQGIMPYDYNAYAKLVNVVHDECSVECTEERAKEIALLQKLCMEKAGKRFVSSLPMLTDPVIKKHWDH
jgi:DNA polymerase-1